MSNAHPLTSIVAHQWHCDHFGHLNVRHYTAAFDDAVFIFWGRLGVIPPKPGTAGTMPVTAEVRTNYRAEATSGVVANIYGRPARIGGKSVTIILEMREEGSGALFATCEVTEVFFDMLARESRPIPETLRPALVALLAEADTAANV